MTKIYAILDTQENKFVMMPSGKVAWDSNRAAVMAYTCHMGPQYWRKEAPKFKEQTRFKIVELTEEYFRLKDLED